MLVTRLFLWLRTYEWAVCAYRRYLNLSRCPRLVQGTERPFGWCLHVSQSELYLLLSEALSRDGKQILTRRHTLQTSSSCVLMSTHRYSELPSTCSNSWYLSAMMELWKSRSPWLGQWGAVWSRSEVTLGTLHSTSRGCEIRNFLTRSVVAASTPDLSTSRALGITSWTFCISTHTHTHCFALKNSNLLESLKVEICWKSLDPYAALEKKED